MISEGLLCASLMYLQHYALNLFPPFYRLFQGNGQFICLRGFKFKNSAKTKEYTPLFISFINATLHNTLICLTILFYFYSFIFFSRVNIYYCYTMCVFVIDCNHSNGSQSLLLAQHRLYLHVFFK